MRVATRPRATVDRWAGYNKTADGVQRSLSELSSSPHRAVAPGPNRPDGVPPNEPVRRRHVSGLTLEAPKYKGPVTAPKTAKLTKTTKATPAPKRVTAVTHSTAPKVKSTNKVSSVQKPRDEKMTCKARPENNKPKGGGGGSMRKFIPWCG